MGVPPELAPRAGETWLRGDQWPPADARHGAWANASYGTTTFREGAWSSNLLAISVIGEFVQAKIGSGSSAKRWNTIALPGYTEPSTTAELAALVDLIEFRPGVLAEALAQRNNILGYFKGVLNFSRASNRKTYDLACVAMQVGQFQAMWYKRWAVYDPGASPPVFTTRQRPRPSQLSPMLLPPIDVPGHPAYPSGHATEAYLVALCLGEVMPAAASTVTPAPLPLPPGSPPPPPSPLMAMAQRIARNREVLGLHYPSDSEAGKIIATASFNLLKKCKTVTDLMADAYQEWH